MKQIQIHGINKNYSECPNVYVWMNLRGSAVSDHLVLQEHLNRNTLNLAQSSSWTPGWNYSVLAISIQRSRSLWPGIKDEAVWFLVVSRLSPSKYIFCYKTRIISAQVLNNHLTGYWNWINYVLNLQLLFTSFYFTKTPSFRKRRGNAGLKMFARHSCFII